MQLAPRPCTSARSAAQSQISAGMAPAAAQEGPSEHLSRRKAGRRRSTASKLRSTSASQAERGSVALRSLATRSWNSHEVTPSAVLYPCQTHSEGRGRRSATCGQGASRVINSISWVCVLAASGSGGRQSKGMALCMALKCHAFPCNAMTAARVTHRGGGRGGCSQEEEEPQLNGGSAGDILRHPCEMGTSLNECAASFLRARANAERHLALASQNPLLASQRHLHMCRTPLDRMPAS